MKDDLEHIIVGRVLRLHGISGTIRVEVSSDVPHRFNAGGLLFVAGTPYFVTSSRQLHQGQVILKLRDVGTPESAQSLLGQLVTVPQTASPQLPPGEYFHFQILGLRVCTEAGEALGRVTEILETGSNDVYVVSGEGGDILVPAIDEVIQEIDLVQRVMVVKLLDGLR